MLVLLAVLLAGPDAAPAQEPPPPAETASTTGRGSIHVESDAVTRDAVVRGLELRVGERWHAWSIEVVDGSAPQAVVVRLRDESGRLHTRELTLTAETTDGRSRELSSALALLIDQIEAGELEQDEGTTTPEEPALAPVSPPVSGWLGVGPRAALNAGRTLDPDVGVSLAGGTWLVRSHLQPVAEVGWSGWTEGTLRVDAVRFGAGALGGASLAGGRLWGGAGVLVRALWSRATAAGTATGWWASPAAVGALQYRGRIFVAGAWLGVDLMLPPLHAHDESRDLRWSIVRPMATVHLGIRLPPARAGS